MPKNVRNILLSAVILVIGVAAVNSFLDSSQVRMETGKRVSSLKQSVTVTAMFTNVAEEIRGRTEYLGGYSAAVSAAIAGAMENIDPLVNALLAAFRIDGKNLRAGTLPANRMVTGAISQSHLLLNTISGDSFPDKMVDSSRFPSNSVSSEYIVEASVEGPAIADGAITERKISYGSVQPAHLAQSMLDLFSQHTASYPGEVTISSGALDPAKGWVPMDGTFYIPYAPLLQGTESSVADTVNPFLPLTKRIERYCMPKTSSIYDFSPMTVSAESLPEAIKNALEDSGITIPDTTMISVYRVPNWTGFFFGGASNVVTAATTPHTDHMHKVLSGNKYSKHVSGSHPWDSRSLGINILDNPFTSASPQLTSASGVNSTVSTDLFTPKHFVATVYLYTGVFYESF